MNVKRIISLIFIVFIILTFLSPIYIQASNQALIDGTLTIKNGEVSFSGPASVTNQSEAMGQVTTKYKDVAVFVGGIMTVTLVGVFIFQFMKLGTLSSQPRERSETIKGLLVTGIAAAILGSVTLFVGLFYGLFR